MESTEAPLTLENSWDHTIRLIITGITMGILHVILGPDHLSALATLAVGSSWKALSLGIRWGLGHSTGLVVIAIIFIYLKGNLDLHTIGRYCDFLVGIFMVVLGLYGISESLSVYHERKTKKDGNTKYDLEIQKLNVDNHQLSVVTHYLNIHDPFTQRILSFLIGLLHGVAGPGAILGVLPAIEMQSYISSFTYLFSFVIASTLSMGTFASFYGEITKRIGSTAESVELSLRIFSASISVTIGVLWLVLSFFGKLEEFFH